MRFGKWLIATVVTASATLSTWVNATEVDSNLPVYAKESGISGKLSSVGSDTLANLMTFWTEEFKKFYPNVNIEVEAKGSSTAPPALIEGTANFGPMSRKMKDNEIAAFEERYRYKPTAIPVAVDGLAVYVHKDNPIEGMTIPQVDALFSVTRKCGFERDITKWGQLGLSRNWEKLSVQLYGRNSGSGTYGYFKKVALCKGDYRNNVNEQPGSASVVRSVGTSLNGVGYSGIGYKTSSVRAVPIAKKPGQAFIEPSDENVLSGKYPLARYLFVYVNQKPNQPLTPTELEFFKLVLSKQGQEIVVKDGYIPLPASVAQKYLTQIQ